MIIQTLTDTEFRAEYLKAWAEYRKSINDVNKAVSEKYALPAVIELIRRMQANKGVFDIVCTEAERRKVF